jgi:hypothetical protein
MANQYSGTISGGLFMGTSVRAFSDGSTGGKQIDKAVMPEIEFMRLSKSWHENVKGATFCGAPALGIYQSLRSKSDSQTYIDFSYRGTPVYEAAAQAFSRMLREPHSLSKEEMAEIAEVLGQTLTARKNGEFVNQIDSASVGAVNGRLVLAVFWRQLRYHRRLISIYINADGEGSSVREIHFSTPAELYDVSHKTFFETMRSVQWASAAVPPPVWSVA